MVLLSRSNVLNRDRTKQLLAMILTVAVLVRIPVAIYMGDQVTELPGIQDQISYDALAHSLLDGRGYSFTENWYPFTRANTPTSHWSFLYPIYCSHTNPQHFTYLLICYLVRILSFITI